MLVTSPPSSPPPLSRWVCLSTKVVAVCSSVGHVLWTNSTFLQSPRRFCLYNLYFPYLC